jgi:hypothetical protein
MQISWRAFVSVVLVVLLSKAAIAQSVSTLMGGRANGMGYASATLFDEWGMFNNIAGIAKIESTTASFAYDLHPSLVGANRTAALIAHPFKIGVVGVGAYRFGDNLYNEHILSAGFSNTFGIASLGLKVNYIQYQTEGFGTKGVVSINFGGIAQLTPILAVGAYITNINQPELNELEKLPTRLAAGISITPTEKIIINTELEKDLEYDPTWKAGIEYKFHSKFCARTGYNINPNTAFFGLGFKTKKFNIDYALQHNVLLSLSHQASIRYEFNKSTK